ncbi:MAG TPA: DUF4183 domain-containing protein [Clostridia bacterium]
MKVNPAIQSFFYEKAAGDPTTGDLTIPAASFTNDAGGTITDIAYVTDTTNGYYLLFINGLLQESGNLVVNSTAKTVTITGGGSIGVGAPIALVVNNFAPSATINITD